MADTHLKLKLNIGKDEPVYLDDEGRSYMRREDRRIYVDPHPDGFAITMTVKVVE